MRILSFGSCNIDYVYAVDHIVAPGETLDAHSRSVFPGGKGLNQSVALARAGAPVFHAGKIGPDGRFLKDLLSESGADVTHLSEEGSGTGHAMIQVEQTGENSILIWGGANREITEEDIDRVLEHFSSEDALLLQNEISSIDYLVKRAHEKGMRIFFNPSPLNETSLSIDLDSLYMILLNRTEACAYAESEDPFDFLTLVQKKHPSLRVVLTLGREGSVYQYKDTRISQPAFTVKAVDTTGAGDTYTGYLIAGLATGSVEMAMKQAAAASAISVSRQGAAASIPTQDEVAQFLKKMK